MTFKVGDKIRGILDTRMKLAKVIELFELNGVEYKVMKIKIIEHTDKTKIGRVYIAYNLDTYFELVEEKEMNKLEELEKKYRELGEEIERLKDEQVYKPKYGENYWFIRYDNEVSSNKWYGDPIDEGRYALGNVFKNKEEGEFRVEQLKVEAELRRFSRPFVVGEDNYKFYFCHRTNSIFMGYYSYVQNGNIYFASKEIAQKAIDTVGEDRIKKYYFGVED